MSLPPRRCPRANGVALGAEVESRTSNAGQDPTVYSAAMRSCLVASLLALAACSASTNAVRNPSKVVGAAAPATAETSWGLMFKAEAEIRRTDLSAVADTLNLIVREFPQSHEAQTTLGLVRFARQEGATPYVSPVFSCTLVDVREIKKSFDSMEAVAKKYHSVSGEKRRAIDAAFGPGTFSSPNLSLDGLLNAMRQMEATRQKALGRQ